MRNIAIILLNAALSFTIIYELFPMALDVSLELAAFFLTYGIYLGLMALFQSTVLILKVLRFILGTIPFINFLFRIHIGFNSPSFHRRLYNRSI